MYSHIFKRVLDFLISLIGLLVISPVFVITTILVLLHFRKNPYFTQKRPGKNERIFKVIKFKTMNECRDSAGNLLSDSERLTPIGSFIRKTSLDEIPQLINVLKGDMSLIGPRPLLVSYLPHYTKEQARRHDVRPGITGWAQVNGRNEMKFSKRFEYDVWYVDNISFMLDLKIVLLTISNVFLSKGIKNGQDVTEVDDLNFYTDDKIK